MPNFIRGQVGYTPEESLDWLKKRTREDEQDLRIALRKKQNQSENTYA